MQPFSFLNEMGRRTAPGGECTVRAQCFCGHPAIGRDTDFRNPSISVLGAPNFGSSRPGVFMVAVADGAVRPLTYNIKPEFFDALATIRGSEVVPEDDIP